MIEASDVTERRSGLSPAKQALLEKRLRDASVPPAEPRGIPRRPDQDTSPLSFAQERFWYLNQLEPGDPVYSRPMALRLTGVLNTIVLEQALREISRRHEILRATFPDVEGQPVQVIAPVLPVSMPVVDLSDLDPSERQAQAKLRATEATQEPFNLARGSLWRGTLLRLGEEEHILRLVMHHIVFDAWSAQVFIKEFAALYEAFSAGDPSPLPELPIQYADFAHWQRGQMQGEVLETQLSYWREKLADAPPMLDLPIDRPRPAIQTRRGTRESLTLPSSLVERLKALSHQEGATLFMTLLAAFGTLLYRYTGQDDIAIGSPIAGRSRVETEGLIGAFINTLVLRIDLSGNPPFQQLLGRVREMALGAYTHQDLPFEKLVEEVKPERDLGRTPLFQVLFNLENLPGEAVATQSLSIEEFEVKGGTTPFDLALEMVEKTEGLVCLLRYSTDLFDATTIKRMLGHFQTVLAGIVMHSDQRLSDLPLLTEPERHQMLVEWNDTETDCPGDLCIHQLFEAQVERLPDAVAVVFEDQQLTYSELNARANQLAHYLRTRKVGPEVVVGLCLERSLEMVVAVLGILKAGGAYVPLDPEYPRARLAYMLEDTQVRLLLTQERLLGYVPEYTGETLCLDREHRLLEQQEKVNPEVLTTPEDLAYVIYTSGSTGKPKGVLIRHKGAVNYLTYIAETYGLNSTDVILQIPSLSFDPSVRDIIGPLTAGAHVTVVNNTDAKDPAALLSRIKEQRVTCLLSVVPTMLNGLIEAACNRDVPYDSIRLILVSGEALYLSTCRKAQSVFGLSASLVNLYGPTECTMTSTYYAVPEPPYDRDIALIGRPIPNARIYILDEYLNPVPVGVPGQLHIGGVGLSRGYLNRPEQTGEAFIPNPFDDDPGARIYRTGDLARYLPDGNIEFLGRIDNQVKLRGFRIELEEVEAALNQHPAVQAVAVLMREDEPGGSRLVAYVVPAQGHPPTQSELRSFLSEKLPDYMIPSACVILDALPLTPTGKLDRKGLPAPDRTKPAPEGISTAPSTSTESLIAEIWQEVLGVDRVGVYDNFFDLGGHSLLSMQVVARLEKRLGLRINPRELILQTLGQLASSCDERMPLGLQSEPHRFTQWLWRTIKRVAFR